MRLFVRTLFAALAIVAALTSSAFAQSSTGTSYTDTHTPPGQAKGAHPLGSYGGGQFDNVNLFNGNLSLNFPLATLAGRGGMTAGVVLSYNSKTWHPMQERIDKSTAYSIPIWDEWDKYNGIAPGWRITAGHMYARRTGFVPKTVDNAPDYYEKTITRLTFVAPDGTEYEFRDKVLNGQLYHNTGDTSMMVVNRGAEWATADGTAATFVSDDDIYDHGEYVEGSSGTETDVTGTVFLRDGTQFRVENGKVMWQRDRNGNRITYGYITQPGPAFGLLNLVTDSLDRQIQIAYTFQNGEFVSVTITLVRGGGSPNRVIVVEMDDLADVLRDDQLPGVPRMGDLFAGLADLEDNGYDTRTPFNPKLPKRILLPGGYEWTFQYTTHGEVARVTTPSHGAVRYNHGFAVGHQYSGHNPESIVFRRVESRRVYSTDSDTQYSSWESSTEYTDPTDKASYYDTGTNELQVNETRYSYDPLEQTVEAVSRTKYFFSGTPLDDLKYNGQILNGTGYPKWMTGREVRTLEQGYVSGSYTNRTEIATSWEQRENPRWSPAPNATTAPQNDTRVKSRKTTIAENGANLVSKVTYTYDDNPHPQTGIHQTPFNNVAREEVTDWGAGAPSSMIIRQVDRVFEETSQYIGYGQISGSTHRRPHLRSLMISETVSGAWGVESVTKYEYDNYARDLNLLHDTLKTYPGLTVPGHDSSFNDGWIYRGNVTMVAVGATTDPFLETTAPKTYTQYDVLGNPLVKVDPQVNEPNVCIECCKTYIDYEQSKFAFPWYTRRSIPSEPTQLSRRTEFDPWTGQLVEIEGENGEITEYVYSDALDRLTSVDSPSGVGDRTYTYSPASQQLSITESSQVSPTNWVTSTAVYDGLARLVSATTMDPDGAGTVSTTTTYDGLGRTLKVTNVTRGSNESTEGYTRTWYDDQSRVRRVETFDTSGSVDVSTGVVTTEYNTAPYSYTPIAGLPAALGTTVTVTDQSGNTRKSVTDAEDRLRVVIEDPNGLNYQTLYRYNARSNLRFVDQGPEQRREYVYDAQSRLTSVTQPEWGLSGSSGGTTTYVYDRGSNLRERVDPRGVAFKTTYQYDELNRVVERDYANTSEVDTRYYYDSAAPVGLEPPASVFPGAGLRHTRGRLYAAVTASTAATQQAQTGSFYAYDVTGRVEWYSQLLDSTYYTTKTTYTLASNTDSETYYEGTSERSTVDNDYNTAGQLSVVKRKPTPSASLTTMATVPSDGYTASGGLRKQQLGNGLYHTIEYNSRLQPEAIGLGTAASGTNQFSHLKLDYEYGVQSDPTLGQGSSIVQSQNNGNIARITITPGAGQQPFEQDFLYDELNRLKLAKEYFGSGGGSACSFTVRPAAPPMGLTAAAVSDSQIDLEWTYGGNDECSFVILRSETSGGPYTEIGTSPANDTTYSDEGLAESTSYYYVVKTRNNIGDSTGTSNQASATTSGQFPPLPTNFVADNVNGIRVDLTWAHNSPAETGFLIQRKDLSNTQPWGSDVQVPANTLSYSDTNVAIETLYQYRITPLPAPSPIPESRWVYSNEVETLPEDWALRFDGVDDYAEALSTSSLTVTGIVTVEAWVLLNELDYYNVIVSKHIQAGAEGGYTLATDNTNHVTFATFSNAGAALATATSSATLQLKRWYHVAGVYDGNTIYIFVDGQLSGSSAVGANKGPATSGSALQIGRSLRNVSGVISGFKYFRGKIDEVRISSAARYTSAFTPTRDHVGNQQDSSTKALWKSNEGTGTTTVDQTTSGNSVTLYNGVLWKPGVTTNSANKTKRRKAAHRGRGDINTVQDEHGTGSEDARAKRARKTGLTWSESYTYDRWGNMAWAAGSFPAKPIMIFNSAKNRIAAVDGSSSAMQYDAAGNVIHQVVGAAIHQYAYDAENRMWNAAVTQSSTTTTLHTYDADGRRVKKKTGSAETRFIYNSSGTLIAEYENSTRSKEYVYGLSGLLSVVENPQGAEELKLLTPDHLGSPRVVTFGSGATSGQVLSRHDYRPFGEEIADERVGNGYQVPDQIRQKFTSYERDEESGLDFAQARYYANVIGRFTSPDVPFVDQHIGSPQSLNLYSYGRNNSIKFTDPTGRAVDNPAYRSADEGWASEREPSDAGYERIVEKRNTTTTTIVNPDGSQSPADSVKVYIWKKRPGYKGHVAVLLADGTYISYWPATDPCSKCFYTKVNVRSPSYEADVKGEGGQAPHEVWNLSGLDQDKIKNWWGRGPSDHGKWQAWGNNCSDIAVAALNAGGAGLRTQDVYTDPADVSFQLRMREIRIRNEGNGIKPRRPRTPSLVPGQRGYRP